LPSVHVRGRLHGLHYNATDTAPLHRLAVLPTKSRALCAPTRNSRRLLLLLLLRCCCCCCCCRRRRLSSQAFFSWYFSSTNGDLHSSRFKFQTAVLSVLWVMLQVQLCFVVSILNVFLKLLPNFSLNLLLIFRWLHLLLV
jgi:hypothetical protein